MPEIGFASVLPCTAETEAAVRRVVQGFYHKVRGDALLGPIFGHHLGDRWDEHLERMGDFWLGVLCQTGQYKGHPMLAHLGIAELGAHHFDHWLKLFAQTINEECDARLGGELMARAVRMRANLQRAVEQVREQARG